jgi:hypothetical protein
MTFQCCVYAQWTPSGATSGNIYNTNSGGNVGIGTSSPSSPLEVKSSSSTISAITWQGTIRANTSASSQYSSYGWYENNVLRWAAYQHPGHNNSLFFANAAGLEKFAITQNGNVGIGTYTPASGLEVSSFQGGIHITDNGNSNFLQVGGNNATSGKGFVFRSTTNSTDLRQFSLLVTDGSTQQERVTILKNGSVGIGTPFLDGNPNNYKLAVNGTIGARSIKVEVSTWSDFVFEDGYKLRPLLEVEKYIAANKHLPEVPSAKEVESKGVDLGAMDAILLQKIEELTLYIIKQEKKMQAQDDKIMMLEKHFSEKGNKYYTTQN